MRILIIEVAKAVAVIAVSTVVVFALHPDAAGSKSEGATASLTR